MYVYVVYCADIYSHRYKILARPTQIQKMTEVQLPRLMAIVKVDGKEISRKAIYASTVQDLEESVRNMYPNGPFWILERALVFDAGFNDYLDVDDHIPSDHEKFMLEFTMPSKNIRRSVEYNCRAAQLQNERSLEAHQVEYEQGSEPVEEPDVKGDVSQVSGLSQLEEEIREKATIFGRTTKELNEYHKSMNDIAFKLALQNPAILEKRGNLLKLAREALHQTGYKYAHGNKTRSKKFGQEPAGTTTNNPWTSNVDHEDVREESPEELAQVNTTRQDRRMKARKTIHKKNKNERMNKIKLYFKEMPSQRSPKKPTNDTADTGFDEDVLTLDEEEIRQRSCIFGRGGRKLNRYQKNINTHAFKLALEDPRLLVHKGELLAKARKSLHDTGYKYAHGNKTRSKHIEEEPAPHSVCLDTEKEEIVEELLEGSLEEMDIITDTGTETFIACKIDEIEENE